MNKIILRMWYSPGDTVLFTAAVESFYKYANIMSDNSVILDVETPYPEVFYNNPYITDLKKDKSAKGYYVDYYSAHHLLRSSGVHVSNAFIYAINSSLNVHVGNYQLTPCLYLSEEEMDRDRILKKYNISGKFWLFNSGIKNDIPLKAYPPLYWQAIVNQLDSHGIQMVQVGSEKHIHTNGFRGISLVGKTENLRDYIVLCYHAEGHICHVSLPMHIMAAFNKPCVVIAGGRENPRWEMYPNHVFLHNVGLLDCCSLDGCWKKKRKECSNMVSVVGSMSYPKCMDMIDPKDIVDAVISYEELLKEN